MIKNIIKRLASKYGYEIRRENSVETYFQKDPIFNALYEEAQIHTQMEATDNLLRRQRHYVLNYLLQNINLKSGDVCETGCWRGLSAYQIAAHIHSLKEDIFFHVFDSFEGLSDIQPVDRYEHDHRDIDSIKKQFSCSMDIVKENLKAFDFIKYYKGWIPERFVEVKDRTFSFVHIDVDLYQPIFDSFKFFYPRLSTGGIMVFDDYGCIQFPGAKKAIDECISQHNDDFFLPLPSGQAFLIKSPVKNL